MTMARLAPTALGRAGWSPFTASGPLLAQTPAPAPAPAAPAGTKPPFIDSAFFATVLDGLMVTAAGISGYVYWRNAKKYNWTKVPSYAFFGIAGLATLKFMIDGSRILK